MSIRSLSLVLLLSVGLVASGAAPAHAGDEDMKSVTEQKSAWAGHGVGSLVHRKSTQETPMGKMVTENKRTLVKITDTHYELNVESKTMVGWTKSVERVPKVVKVEISKVKPEDAGEETLTIEGKAYPCKKKKAKDVGALIPGNLKPPSGRPGGPGGAFEGAGTIWLHPTLGMLKSEMTTSMMGQSVKVKMAVTRLKVSKKIGETTVECREMTMTNSMMPNGKIVTLSSPLVPGGTVRSEMSMSQAGMKMSRVEELVAWVKKPLAPVTGK